MNTANSLSLATKEQVVEALLEIMHSHREEFSGLLLEALEDSALGIAIEEGRQQDFVSEEEIMSILQSEISNAFEVEA